MRFCAYYLLLLIVDVVSPPNAEAIVISKDDNGLFSLVTRHGVLKQRYTRNQFSPCEEQFLRSDGVPQHESKFM